MSRGLLALLSCTLAAAVGCSPGLNKGSFGASSGSPESTRAEVISIPRDDAKPTYVVAVEPFVFSQTLAKNENVMEINVRSGGGSLAANSRRLLRTAATSRSSTWAD